MSFFLSIHHIKIDTPKILQRCNASNVYCNDCEDCFECLNDYSIPQYDGGGDEKDDKNAHSNKNKICNKHKIPANWQKRMIGQHKQYESLFIVVYDIMGEQILGISFEDNFNNIGIPLHYNDNEFIKTPYVFEGSWDVIYKTNVCKFHSYIHCLFVCL